MRNWELKKLENLLMVIQPKSNRAGILNPIYLKTRLAADLCNRQAHIGGRENVKKTQRQTLTLLLLEESLDVQSVKPRRGFRT